MKITVLRSKLFFFFRKLRKPVRRNIRKTFIINSKVV